MIQVFSNTPLRMNLNIFIFRASVNREWLRRSIFYLKMIKESISIFAGISV